ncbi:MAG: RNA-binding protein [Deltaproteobacteria bacterium]|nr:RNA-binding protein [Deltaproteobacteria bacterium]
MGKKLYVGNLPYSATEGSLTDLFSRYGTVESVTIVTDRDTGRSKGFGFVEMGSDQEAADAIGRTNGAEMDGRTITVSEARPQPPRQGGGPRGGRGGGRGGGGFRR